MRIIFILLLVLLSPFCELKSQQIDRPVIDSKMLFNRMQGDSPYELFYNPALLIQDPEPEVLCLRSVVNNSEGGFKPFVQPGRTSLYRQSVSGKKQINAHQIFKGRFGFQKLVRDEWDWLATRDLHFGMPFLLGDATSGATHFNAILIKAEYCHLFEKLSLGVSLDYQVDEGLKEVSPKPTSKHRDIHFTIGAGYKLSKKLSLEMITSVSDNNEEIYYREDKTSAYQEVTLVKFRGYDLPLLLNKKVETRYGYFDDYRFAGSVRYKWAEKSFVQTYFENGIQQINIQDNAIDPREEGYWQNHLISGGLKSVWSIGEGVFWRLHYHYGSQAMWARHPNYNTVMSDVKLPQQAIATQAELHLNSELQLLISTGFGVSKIEYSDYFSALDWSAEQQRWSLRTGTNYQIRPALGTSIFAGYANVNSSGVAGQLKPDVQYRQTDIDYYLTQFREITVDMAWRIFFRDFGLVNLIAEYRRITPGGSQLFDRKTRSELFLKLEIWVKAY
ncbi:MAG TPA: hypothetical protein ENN22_15885 [bacterium]|nr:hypothetical protein [bacterium]